MAIQENKNTGGQDFIRIQDLFYLCASRWQWFVVSLLVCIGAATFYLLKTPSVYTRTASILIKDDSKDKSAASEIEDMANFGVFTSKSNVNDEIGTLKSPDLMKEVVGRLHLNMTYMADGHFHDETLYGDNLPITVAMINLPSSSTASFDVELDRGNIILLSNFVKNGEYLGDASVIKGKLNQMILTPLGKVVVSPSVSFHGHISDKMFIHISCSTLQEAVEQYSSNLSISQTDEKSNIIALSYNDVSTQRAENILSTLIAAYNESWIKDKNQMAVSTSMFITERLGVIEDELGNVDNDISSFKSANLLPDVQEAAKLYMTQASDAKVSLEALNNQAYMARYVRDYLSNDANKFQLLPANSGIGGPAIESQISDYNKQLLDRNSLVSQSSTKNPLVVQLDASLAGMRKALLHTVDNQLVSLNEQIKSQRGNRGQATSQIASNPKQAKYLLSVERQQKVKEALYLYLLQKREENELSQAFTAYNTRIIAAPDGSMVPTSPVKRNVLLVAFVLGLLLPVVLVFIRENTNTTVRGRKDLEKMTTPFVGEIPYVGQDGHGFRKREKKKCIVAVKEKSRDIINEAFRVVRTNLEFMQGVEQKSHVIMLTSANSDSGKTFITFNLATSFAIKDKKTVVVDLDLRKASLSNYINRPKKGISDYLAGRVDETDDIIYKSSTSTLSVIPVGTLPPNPTEMLFSKRLKQLLDMLRTSYDYIFIDCPPIEIVADADIINKQVDMTLFVVRAGLLDRSMLPVIEKSYTDQKYKNLSILLNGTDSINGRYGYKYGYKYGYHYGYGEYQD